MKKIFTSVVMLLALSFVSNCFAGGILLPPTYDLVGTNEGTKTDTKAYAGLKWSLGGGTTPALVLGVMRGKVKSDGDTRGGNLSLGINLAGGVKPEKLKLGYLYGKEKVQGELSAGYNFISGKPLLALGVNGPYINGGVDFSKDEPMTPFMMLHTHGEFDKPSCKPVDGGRFSFDDCTNVIEDLN